MLTYWLPFSKFSVFAIIFAAKFCSSHENDYFPENFIFGSATSAYQVEGAWNISGKEANVWDDAFHQNPKLSLDGGNGDVAADSEFLSCQENYSFPENFIFGAATSAYQVEGAWNISGKGANVWDDAFHKNPKLSADGNNGDVAADSYHFYKEDVAALKNMGAKMYRFSLSWSRLLPTGFINDKNEDGKIYYNNLIDELIRNGIEPMVTIYHYDLPGPLQRLGGLTNRVFIDLFLDYARYAFQLFGNRVKYWVTFNEPVLSCNVFYGSNIGAPGLNLPEHAPYLCVHNLLLAHGHTYHMYNALFRVRQNGYIGIINHVIGYQLRSDSMRDIIAANLGQEYTNGWIMNPIFSIEGDYPKEFKSMLKQKSRRQNYTHSRLPSFTKQEIRLLRGSADYFGMNYYSTYVFTFDEVPSNGYESKYIFVEDYGIKPYQLKLWRNEENIEEFLNTPNGLRGALRYIKKKYRNPPIIITESGIATSYYNGSNDLNDYARVDYINDNLSILLKSIYVDQVNVLAYLAWSLIDTVEWMSGFQFTFGLHKVNFTSPTKERIRRLSSYVYQYIIDTGKIDRSFLPVL